MEIKSILRDEKVSADSILIEVCVREYLELAREIVKNNVFQRKRVRGSKSVYSLLKADFLAGCVIPPIVLAYTRPDGDLAQEGGTAFQNYAGDFSILDGLQRTYTLMDIYSDQIENAAILDQFLSRKIRCEVYQGIDRMGILYRMLTLNTGQTSMSLRHQIEIMYVNYLDMNVDGVTFIREKDGARARQLNCYNFKDIIEGFNSYVERNESPIDRADVLENISSLENLSRENKHQDVFKGYVKAWHAFIEKINNFSINSVDSAGLTEDESFEDEDYENVLSGGTFWAKNGVQAFKRAQAISGFGAAVGLLRDDDPGIQFETLPIGQLIIGADAEDFLDSLNRSMASIKEKSRRIGNAQRLYFKQFFRMLFWEQSGCYLNLFKAQEEAYKSTLKFGI